MCSVRVKHAKNYACGAEETFSSIFSSDSEANASELLEIIEEMCWSLIIVRRLYEQMAMLGLSQNIPVSKALISGNKCSGNDELFLEI